MSQGCFMALYLGFTYPGKIFGGLIGCCGFINNKVTINHCIQSKEMPILLYHGLNDNAIDVNFALSTYQKVLQNCINSRLIKAIGVGHSINTEAKIGIKEFLFKYAK